MSTDTASTPVADDSTEHAEEHTHHGASDMLFVKTAIALALITALEVAWTYIPWPEGGGIWTVAEVGGLLIMMAVKFFVVANVFMHLKWDHKLLTGVFFFGLFLALFVYLIVLFVFEFFSKSGPPYV